MTIVQINTTCGIGSTGKIAASISEMLLENNVENYILYSSRSNGYSKGISCCKAWYQLLQALKSYLIGNYGFNSHIETLHIISEIHRLSPDAVLLHNIHGHDCNLRMFFEYCKSNRIKLFWTFHDCWAFTAYCTHFLFERCEKWKTGCHNCPQRKTRSAFFDNSKALYKKKKELLSGLDMTIITPSQWLADVVKQSFLKEYPIKVIHNGIDLSIFSPTKSDFRRRYHILDDQFVLLGVAFQWNRKKGLDVFIDLSRRLDPKRYRIVLVGTDIVIDKSLPENIISIHRTQNQRELAEIYTAADIFLNPTREDTFPTVNLEALACGLPVITFDVGGSPECIDDSCGAVVPVDDIDALEQIIGQVTQEKPFNTKTCLARAERFDKNKCYGEYVKLILGENVSS